jgi:hypothetical protein
MYKSLFTILIVHFTSNNIFKNLFHEDDNIAHLEPLDENGGEKHAGENETSIHCGVGKGS